MSTNSVRPIPWLNRGDHPVDRLINLGYLSIQAGVSHVACDWGLRAYDPEAFDHLIPHDYLWRGMHKDPDALNSISIFDLNFALLEPSACPVPYMSRTQILGWWYQIAFCDEMEVQLYYEMMVNPDFLIEAGVRHLRNSFAHVCEDAPQLGACLSLIGAGVVPILVAGTCIQCRLRRATFGTPRCGECNRSKWVRRSTDDGNGDARSHRSRRIKSIVGELSFDVSEYPAAGTARSIACILFGMSKNSQAYLSWIGSVSSSLAKAPLVRALLPANFADLRHQEQLTHLRQSIDPCEWDYSVWPTKITHAQSWIEAEMTLRSRKRGPGPTGHTFSRALEAHRLLRDGLSKSKVAESLGITLSNLSHILKRTANRIPPDSSSNSRELSPSELEHKIAHAFRRGF